MHNSPPNSLFFSGFTFIKRVPSQNEDKIQHNPLLKSAT